MNATAKFYIGLAIALAILIAVSYAAGYRAGASHARVVHETRATRAAP